MLKSITIENFRSFGDAATLRLRPITILLGRNSSGKSSITRMLPLLRQSLERQTASPILWVTEELDFGSVAEVITHGAESEEIEIGFELDGRGLSDYGQRRSPWTSGPVGELQRTVRFSAFLRSESGKTSYTRTKICIDDHVAEIIWDEYSIDGVSRILVDGRDMFQPGGAISLSADKTTLFPQISRQLTQDEIESRQFQPSFYQPIFEKLDYFFHQKTAKEKRSYFSRQLPYVPPKLMHSILSNLPNIVSRRLDDILAVRELSDATLVNDLPRIIAFVGAQLRNVFQRVGYIGPVRASGRRFYRLQELSVSSIDSRGESLGMYLNALGLVDEVDSQIA